MSSGRSSCFQKIFPVDFIAFDNYQCVFIIDSSLPSTNASQSGEAKYMSDKKSSRGEERVYKQVVALSDRLVQTIK
ncbi:MAG: hypothetical protein AAB401_13070, partial [Acidobacteriota bacterium]